MYLRKASKLFPSIRYHTLMQDWVKETTNPVIHQSASGWDSVQAHCPCVIKDGSTYKVWYQGTEGTGWRIGYATSLDGITWTKYGSNPVLTVGSGWESTYVLYPCVIKDTDYKMWYSGQSGSNVRIGYATSGDGTTWTKYGGNPVIDLGSGGTWDDVQVQPFSVIKINNIYKMWYAGYNGSNTRIGYASSGDGTTWTKYGSNPVLDLGTGGSWDDAGVSSPSVIKEGLYKMLHSGYDGTNYRIGYATSLDGITWSKRGMVLDLGSGGSWDDRYVNTPSLIIDDGYKMWYGGYLDGIEWQIGLATSY